MSLLWFFQLKKDLLLVLSVPSALQWTSCRLTLKKVQTSENVLAAALKIRCGLGLLRAKFKRGSTRLKKRSLDKLVQSVLLTPRINSTSSEGVTNKVNKSPESIVFDRFAASETYMVLLQSRRASSTTYKKKLLRQKEIYIFELPRRKNRCRKERERFSWVC